MISKKNSLKYAKTLLNSDKKIKKKNAQKVKQDNSHLTFVLSVLFPFHSVVYLPYPHGLIDRWALLLHHGLNDHFHDLIMKINVRSDNYVIYDKLSNKRIYYSLDVEPDFHVH